MVCGESRQQGLNFTGFAYPRCSFAAKIHIKHQFDSIAMYSILDCRMYTRMLDLVCSGRQIPCGVVRAFCFPKRHISACGQRGWRLKKHRASPRFGPSAVEVGRESWFLSLFPRALNILMVCRREALVPVHVRAKIGLDASTPTWQP